MGLYDGTKFEWLDEPRRFMPAPLCKDCLNFIHDGAFCRQARLYDPVYGRVRYQSAESVRFADSKYNCGQEGQWFLPTPPKPSP